MHIFFTFKSSPFANIRSILGDGRIASINPPRYKIAAHNCTVKSRRSICVRSPGNHSPGVSWNRDGISCLVGVADSPPVSRSLRRRRRRRPLARKLRRGAQLRPLRRRRRGCRGRRREPPRFVGGLQHGVLHLARGVQQSLIEPAVPRLVRVGLDGHDGLLLPRGVGVGRPRPAAAAGEIARLDHFLADIRALGLQLQRT